MNKRRVLLALLLFAVFAAGAFAIFRIGSRPPLTSPVELVPTTWKTARETPMHVMHVGTKKIACTECHTSQDAPPPTEAVCTTKCHAEEVKTHHRGAAPVGAGTPPSSDASASTGSTTCLSCHVFGAGKAAAQCSDCHDAAKRAAGAPPLEHHVSKEMPCRACHAMHKEPKTVSMDCTTCHTKTSATHGTMSAHPSAATFEKGDAASTPLGVSPPNPRVSSSSLRSSSSTDLVLTPAIAAFAREGGASDASSPSVHTSSMMPSDSADGSVLAFAFNDGGGGARASERGPHDDHGAGAVCTTCHAPHTGKEAARATCEGCHVPHGARFSPSQSRAPSPSSVAALALVTRVAAPEITPRGRHVAGHEACITCHEPHKARRADVRACLGCHSDHRAVTSVQGHAACTGCHTPHAPAEARTSCSTTCHSNVKTMASERVSQHAACASCHDPHRPSESPGTACVRCHESTKPTHPPAPRSASSSDRQGAGEAPQRDRGACIGCHAPHGEAPHAAVAAAARTIAKPTPLGAHGHTAASCISCHAKVVATTKTAASSVVDQTAHAKGVACTQCHTPHAFKIGATPKLCAQCHAAKATAVASRPGHAQCNDCHGAPHAPVVKPSCQTCHAAESHSAPKGHATCTSCHDAHAGGLVARASSCTNCHENKKSVLHATLSASKLPSAASSIVTASDGTSCKSCHRAHGPKGPEKPAPCTSCHARPSLGGLHSKNSHASCESCHSAHVPPRSDRATCTGSCHADKRNHQPAATSCKGCHLFRQ